MISGEVAEIRKDDLPDSNYEIHGSVPEIQLYVPEVPRAIFCHRLAIRLRVFRAIGSLWDTGPALDSPRTLVTERFLLIILNNHIHQHTIAK
jgi:hypothetical protein